MTDEEKKGLGRRDFLKIGGAATAGLIAGSTLPQAAEAKPEHKARPGALPKRNLGKTGYHVTIFGLGGQAAIEQQNNEEMAVAIVERAIDLGVNYLDTAAVYGRGISQKYIGQVMKRRRKEVWLATKARERSRDGAWRQLEESLKSLQTDHLDTWQLHNITKQADVDEIFAKDGAIEAVQQARDQKLVRFVGVTGHADPEVLLEMLRRYPFDTILMAVNAADPHKLSFQEKLLPAAVEKNMGIIGMKIPSRGRLLTKPNPQGVYYEEGQKPGTISMKDALYYTLSLPVSTVIVGCDNLAQLEENVKLAREFTPLSQAQMEALAEKTAPIAEQALFYRYKS